MNCYVYFLIHTDGDRFKIGVSYDPQQRARTLEQSLDLDASFKVRVSTSNQAFRLEKTLHYLFQNDRISIAEPTSGYTEWFGIDALEAALAFVEANMQRLNCSQMLPLLGSDSSAEIDGDAIEVDSLGDLARSLSGLLKRGEELHSKGVGLIVRNSAVLPATAEAGAAVLETLTHLAQFERSLTAQRIRSARNAARTRGVQFGRRPTLTASQIEHARKLIDDEGRSVAEVAGILNVHRATLYRALSSH